MVKEESMPNKSLILLGKMVTYYRNKFDMSLKDLACKSGIRYSYLCKIEKGGAFGINLSHLEKICDVFNIKVSELCDFNQINNF